MAGREGLVRRVCTSLRRPRALGVEGREFRRPPVNSAARNWIQRRRDPAPERLPVLFPRDFFSGILLLRVPLLSDVSQRALVGRAPDSSFAFVDLSPALQAAGMAVKRAGLTQGPLSAVGTVLAENKDVAGQRNRAAEIRREPPEEPSHELHSTLGVGVGGGGMDRQAFGPSNPKPQARL